MKAIIILHQAIQMLPNLNIIDLSNTVMYFYKESCMALFSLPCKTFTCLSIYFNIIKVLKSKD